MKSIRSLLVRIYVEVRDETAFLAALADYTGRHGLAASVYGSTYVAGEFTTPLCVVELINDPPFDRLETVRGHAVALAQSLRRACGQVRVAVQSLEGGTTWQVDDESTG